MKISLSIATYQRADYIERMSASLLASVNIEHVNVRIYDDCSPNWTIADLQGLFPYAKEIVRRSKNLKADANMKQIFEDFLSTDDDVLLLADSDLIYRSGWLDLLEEMLPATDGILSLYNSRLHPFEENSASEDTIRDKIHLGAAGTAFTRDRVQDIVDANMEGVNYDWAWSELFKKRGYRLMCVQESYIQHIGIIGQNNRGSIMHFDMARNFVADNLVTQKIMAIFLDELVEENNKFYQNLGIDENFLNMRIYDNNMQVNQPFCKNKWGGVSILHYLRVRIRQCLFSLLKHLI